MQDSLFPGEDRRTKSTKLTIIEAFIALIAERGPFRLTFADIAEAAGTTRSQVRYHFGDMENLLVKSVNYANYMGQRLTVDLMKPEMDPLQQISAIIDGAFLWFETNPNWLSLILLTSSFCHNSLPLKKSYWEPRDFGQRRLQSILADYLCGASEESGASIKSAARTIQVTILGFLSDLLNRNDIEVNAAKKNCHAAIMMILADLFLRHQREHR